MSKIIKHVVSRRGFLKGTAMGSLGLAAAAVIGCGEDEAAAPAASGAKPTVTPANPVTPAAKPVEKKAAPAAAPKPAVKKVITLNFGSNTKMPTMSPIFPRETSRSSLRTVAKNPGINPREAPIPTQAQQLAIMARSEDLDLTDTGI